MLRTNLDVTVENPAAGLVEYQYLAGIVQRAVLRLERLVEQLLLLAREQQPRQNEPVALGPLLEEAVARLQPLAEQQRVGIHLAGDAAISVAGDATLLFPLFRNLLENGILYNRPEGAVTIRLDRQGHEAVATIADTGPGILAVALPHLFERFYRGEDARRRQPAGSGLGLAIVEQVARQHGGMVTVASNPGNGTTFTVRLPLAANAVERAHLP